MKAVTWVHRAVVHAVHELQIREHGGTMGIRDMDLLESALARPLHLLAYSEASLFGLSAAYTHGIVKNHPFLDGNKRTGFVVGILFLESNGFRFNAPEDEAIRKVLALASGDIAASDYEQWLEENSEQA